MSRTWLSIRVELVSGRGVDLWPRPGRVFTATRSHSFWQLAAAIDLGFARWDLAHTHVFTLADATVITELAWWGDQAPAGGLDSAGTALGWLVPGEQFAYVFDLGEVWAYRCTVVDDPVDPLDELGLAPEGPVPYAGWGTIPDQYGRRWDTDGASEPTRPVPMLGDLPPILPEWGQPG